MNAYRRAERENAYFRSANQYSRTQSITCRKRRFLNSRGAVGRLENGFSAIHTDTNIGILDDNISGMTHFSEWLSIHTNIGIQVNTTGCVSVCVEQERGLNLMASEKRQIAYCRLHGLR